MFRGSPVTRSVALRGCQRRRARDQILGRLLGQTRTCTKGQDPPTGTAAFPHGTRHAPVAGLVQQPSLRGDSHGLSTILRAKLADNGGGVELDRALGDGQRVGDLLAG